MELADILMILGFAVLVLGTVTVAIGKLWFLIQCFCESIWWGLGCLFIPFVSLVFLIVHWPVAKKPFALIMIGFCTVLVIMILMPEILNEL